jgi:transaldolase
MSKLKELHRFGQSPWLDIINRPLLTNGGLQKLIDEDRLTGVTSNPVIFQRAFGQGSDYAELISSHRELAPS